MMRFIFKGISRIRDLALGVDCGVFDTFEDILFRGLKLWNVFLDTNFKYFLVTILTRNLVNNVSCK